MHWEDKFFEVLGKLLPIPDDLESERVVARYEGGKVIFHGVNDPIPPEVISSIVAEVFPLIQGRTGEISLDVITSDFLVSQVKGFAQHCEIQRMILP